MTGAPIDADDVLQGAPAEAFEDWTFAGDRLLEGRDAIAVTWSTPAGPVVMVWPLTACEA